MIALAASLFLAASIPPPSANQQWTRVTTPRFTIISATGERATRDMAHDLETLAAALHDLLPETKQPPTRVIVFARRGEAQPYIDLLLNHEQSRATGVFVLQRGAATMLIDTSRGRVADRTPYHELVHYLLAGAEQHPPLWLEEGIAEYYSNARIAGSLIRVGLPVREHLARLARPNTMPARDLFAVTRSSTHATDLMFYAESWVIVDWMLRTSQTEFRRFLRDTTRGVPIDAALREHFHRQVDDVDSLIKHYIPPQFTMLMKADTPPDSQVETKAVSHADAVFELARLLSTLDRAAADADRHFRLVLDQNPNHAAALAGLGRLRSREAKDGEAWKLFDLAIAADPDDATIQLMYAEALLRPEIGGGLAETVEHTPADLPRFRRARELARSALAHGADETRSRGAIGTSYIVEDDSAPGIPELERAHALFPQRTDYPLHLLSLYVRAGDHAKASRLAAKLETTLSPALRAVMFSVLLREDIACINAMYFRGDLDGAVAALRALIETTKDKGTREQLVEQLAAIQSP